MFRLLSSAQRMRRDWHSTNILSHCAVRFQQWIPCHPVNSICIERACENRHDNLHGGRCDCRFNIDLWSIHAERNLFAHLDCHQHIDHHRIRNWPDLLFVCGEGQNRPQKHIILDRIETRFLIFHLQKILQPNRLLCGSGCYDYHSNICDIHSERFHSWTALGWKAQRAGERW